MSHTTIKPARWQQRLKGEERWTPAQMTIGAYLVQAAYRAPAHQGGWFTVSQADLAGDAHVRRETVNRYLRAFCEAGWLERKMVYRQGRQRPSMYRLLDPDRVTTGHTDRVTTGHTDRVTLVALNRVTTGHSDVVNGDSQQQPSAVAEKPHREDPEKPLPDVTALLDDLGIIRRPRRTRVIGHAS